MKITFPSAMKVTKYLSLFAFAGMVSLAGAATFVIEKYGTGYSIDGNGGAIEGQQIYLWPTNTGNVNQKWVQIDQGNGYYSYKKRH